MRHVSKSKLVFIMLAGVWAGTLFWNSAAHAEDKTITAHIEMDRQLGTTKIEDDADADARVVIDGLQDNPDQNAPARNLPIPGALPPQDYR